MVRSSRPASCLKIRDCTPPEVTGPFHPQFSTPLPQGFPPQEPALCTYRWSSSFLFSRVGWWKEGGGVRGWGQGLTTCAGSDGVPPWTRGTHSGLHRASGSRGVGGKEDYWGVQGRARQGGGGHSRPHSCPPAPARPSVDLPPGPSAQTAAAGSA